MASKLTQLTEITSPTPSDIVYLVNDPAGTPTSKKITVDNLLSLRYAQLYTHDGAGSQTVSTTYDKVTQWGNNGLANGLTPDAVNNKITLPTTGNYYVVCNMSFTGTQNTTVTAAIFLNDVEQTQGEFQRKLSNNDIGAGGFSCVIDSESNNLDLDVRVKFDSASNVFALKQGQFLAFRIAKT